MKSDAAAAIWLWKSLRRRLPMFRDNTMKSTMLASNPDAVRSQIYRTFTYEAVFLVREAR